MTPGLQIVVHSTVKASYFEFLLHHWLLMMKTPQMVVPLLANQDLSLCHIALANKRTNR